MGNALGSIEAGKIANVVVATGDPFARESRIRQVFVDGKLFEPDDLRWKPKPGVYRINVGKRWKQVTVPQE